MKTILLIGSDEQEQQSIINILQNEGLSVITAKNWEDALSLLENHSPIITMFNAMRGVEVNYYLRLFKNEPRTAKLMLVMLYPSEVKWNDIKPSCFSKYQADAYLEKPLETRELIGTIKQLLR